MASWTMRFRDESPPRSPTRFNQQTYKCFVQAESYTIMHHRTCLDRISSDLQSSLKAPLHCAQSQ